MCLLQILFHSCKFLTHISQHFLMKNTINSINLIFWLVFIFFLIKMLKNLAKLWNMLSFCFSITNSSLVTFSFGFSSWTNYSMWWFFIIKKGYFMFLLILDIDKFFGFGLFQLRCFSLFLFWSVCGSCEELFLMIKSFYLFTFWFWDCHLIFWV